MSAESRVLRQGAFTISLDFELMWGVYDSRNLGNYGQNILGTRSAISKMLELFAHYELGVTWATVGLLMCRDRTEMLERIEEAGLTKHHPGLVSYIQNNVGENRASDPYHFGDDLVAEIDSFPRQEIGSHSFSHYGVLEEYATPVGFEVDMNIVKKQFADNELVLNSYVFARNQMSAAYIDALRNLGIQSFRGCPKHRLYAPISPKNQKRHVRLAKFFDSLLPLSSLSVESLENNSSMLDTVASRFLRPMGVSGLGKIQLQRIKSEMTSAARRGHYYHLWWHPHNFGKDTDSQLDMLTQILSHFTYLKERFSWPSMNMHELSENHNK